MLTAGLLLLTGLSLELSSPQQAVLVGEPIKVVVRWKATADVPLILIESPDFMRRTLAFVVDDGAGSTRYKEWPRSLADPITAPGALVKGEEVVVNHVLLKGTYEGRAAGIPVFGAPGQYRVKAAYAGPGAGQPVESNTLTFTVSAPSGEELTVRELLVREPHLLGGDGKLERVQEVVTAHPTSRYLAWAKVVLYERRASKLHNRYDPDTGESFWHLDRSALAAALTPRYRSMALAVLGDNWGVFEEERLFQGLSYSAASGERELAQQARDQLLTNFPRSMAATEVRDYETALAEAAIMDEETDDTPPPPNDATPPTLVLSPSPSSLWPPSHKMVTVKVTVTVSDNVDPNPVVKLVSITCDDACDPSSDVAGATLDTDDRQFQLRAERSGGGTGRSYTITYSAKDATGNTTTKATMVRVPHDQGT